MSLTKRLVSRTDAAKHYQQTLAEEFKLHSTVSSAAASKTPPAASWPF